MAKFVLERRKIPIIGRGRAIGSNIHISSVTSLFSLLFEAALQHRDDAIWGPEAYYLVEKGEHCWGDVARSIGRIALETELLPSPPDDQVLDYDFALELAGFEATGWGYNMRARASRALLQLDWEPRAPSLEEELPQIVGEEYQRLQLR